MKRASAAAVLIGLLLVGFLAPLADAAALCADCDGGEPCGVDCALCLCCSHLPTTAAGAWAVSGTGGGGALLGDAASPAPASPLPRTIPHVPWPA
ncbi:MAG TPA: hypothetical protein VHM02_05890, partial [Thermoanaerobaculia bacterium]|nr:hypothetical protein [Thermoanaerobaculia bacterium]